MDCLSRSQLPAYGDGLSIHCQGDRSPRAHRRKHGLRQSDGTEDTARTFVRDSDAAADGGQPLMNMSENG